MGIWSDVILTFYRPHNNIYNGFMYFRSGGNYILQRVLQRMLTRGVSGGVNTLRHYHYNLKLLREEVESLIGRPCANLTRAVERLRVGPTSFLPHGLNITLLTRARRSTLSFLDTGGEQLLLMRNVSGKLHAGGAAACARNIPAAGRPKCT